MHVIQKSLPAILGQLYLPSLDHVVKVTFVEASWKGQEPAGAEVSKNVPTVSLLSQVEWIWHIPFILSFDFVFESVLD